MDQWDHRLQFSNRCNRLFNFLKSLATQALKTFTLGPPPLMNQGFSHVPIPIAAQDGADSKISGDEMTAARPGEAALSEAKIELEEDSTSKTFEPSGPHGGELQPVQGNDSQTNFVKRQLEEEETLSAAAPQPKAPKKTVSFHDVVEEISSKDKQNKKIKATKRSTSLDREDDPKPLRSILKVGSKLIVRSDSFVNPSGDG